MSFPAYGVYKDSGIEWLGKMPSHWIAGPIRFFAQLQSGHTPSRQHPEYWENCTIPWFSLADVAQLRSGRIKYVYDTKETISELGLANSSARLLPAGTVMLSRTASVGFSAIMGCDMATTQDFANWVCGPRLKPEFLLASLHAMSGEFRRLMMGSTHQTIYMPDIAKLAISLPPVQEQEAIVSFLDRETAKIDDLVAEQQRLIELLQEKRQAVISHAVTKGLDPSAPMKDSGVEWLGEVPAHWNVSTLGNIAELIQTGPFGSQLHAHDYIEGGVPVVNPSHIQDGIIIADQHCTVDEQTRDRLSTFMLESGDIIVGRRGEMGRCAVVREEEVGWLCGTGSLFVRLSSRGLPEFVCAAIRTDRVREALKLSSVGSTMDNLNEKALANCRFALPPLKEQAAICEHLNGISKKIDDLIGDAAASTALLQERRAALISAAVTGKIDVRNSATAPAEAA
jgi:type I restriction enzyme S subunit